MPPHGVSRTAGSRSATASSCAATRSTTRTSAWSWAAARRSSSTPVRRTPRRARSSTDLRELTRRPGHGRRRHARPLRPRLRQPGSSGRPRSGARPAASRSWSDRRGAEAAIAAEEPELAATSTRSSSTRPTGRSTRHATHRGRRSRGGAALPGPRPHRPRRRDLGPGHGRRVGGRPRWRTGSVPFFGDGYPLDWPATAAALRPGVDEGPGRRRPGPRRPRRDALRRRGQSRGARLPPWSSGHGRR